MKRRTFIKGLLAGAVLVAVGPLVPSAPTLVKGVIYKRMPLYVCPLTEGYAPHTVALSMETVEMTMDQWKEYHAADTNQLRS